MEIKIVVLKLYLKKKRKEMMTKRIILLAKKGRYIMEQRYNLNKDSPRNCFSILASSFLKRKTSFDTCLNGTVGNVSLSAFLKANIHSCPRNLIETSNHLLYTLEEKTISTTWLNIREIQNLAPKNLQKWSSSWNNEANGWRVCTCSRVIGNVKIIFIIKITSKRDFNHSKLI